MKSQSSLSSEAFLIKQKEKWNGNWKKFLSQSSLSSEAFLIQNENAADRVKREK